FWRGNFCYPIPDLLRTVNNRCISPVPLVRYECDCIPPQVCASCTREQLAQLFSIMSDAVPLESCSLALFCLQGFAAMTLSCKMGRGFCACRSLSRFNAHCGRAGSVVLLLVQWRAFVAAAQTVP